MKKMQKRVGMLILAIILVVAFIPFEKLSVHAEEEPDENVTADTEEAPVLGAVNYKVGDIIKFGKYEQDGNTSNGKEDIVWQVLKVDSGRILVISKYALDSIPFNTGDSDGTWENCSLRKWLNNDFKSIAFSAAEQEKILSVNIENKDNPYYGTPGGNNTTDQIFCLSLEELESYFGNYSWYDSESRLGYNQNFICPPTQYAINNGAWDFEISESYYNSYLKDKGYTKDVIGRHGVWWWLRSPGYNSFAYTIDYFGTPKASYPRSLYYGHFTVRPALYINTSVKPTSITLDKNSATMYFGEEMLLKPTLAPADVTETKITWSVNNKNIASVNNNGLVKVWGAGNVKVTAKTVNGLTATCDILVLAENNPSNPFADIKSGDWKYNAASYVLEKGYMNGKGTLAEKVLFSPDTPINRSMFVQTLYNVEGKPLVEYNQKFNDVSEGAWYAKPVTWAEKNNVVAGNADGSFGVNGVATREQLAQMFYKYAKYKGLNTDVVEGSGKRVSDFPDAEKVSSWAVASLNWALSRGIMSGKGSGKLDPKGSATRVECATMLRNFMNAYKDAVPKLSSAPELSEEDLLAEEIAEKEALAPEDMPEEDTAEEKVQEEKETSDEDAIQNEDTAQNEETVQNEDTTQDEDVIQENDTVQNEESIQDENTIAPEAGKIE